MVLLSTRLLFSRLAPSHNVMALCLTATSTEIAVANIAIGEPSSISSGEMLSAERIKQLIHENKVGGLLMGGSALFRANGQTQFGARKIISEIHGVEYQEETNIGPKPPAGLEFPIALWREEGDDPVEVILKFIKENKLASDE